MSWEAICVFSGRCSDLLIGLSNFDDIIMIHSNIYAVIVKNKSYYYCFAKLSELQLMSRDLMMMHY